MTPSAAEKLTTLEDDHALCSASGSHGWLNCPGKVKFEQQFPKSTSVYAEEGTQAHSLADWQIKHALKRMKNSKTDQFVPLVRNAKYEDFFGGKRLVNQDMIFYVTRYGEVVWDKMLEVKPKSIFLEQKVILSKTLKMYGTADCCFGKVIDGVKTGWLYDLKYGKGVEVFAEDEEGKVNSQLAYYACAMQEQFGQETPFDIIHAHIVQPRISDDPEEYIKQVTFTRVDLARWKKTLLAGAGKVYQFINNPALPLELHAGDHCRFCSAQPGCAEYAKMISREAGIDFVAGEFGDNLPIPIATEDGVLCLDEERIVKIIKHKATITKFLKAVEAYVVDCYLVQGKVVSGLKVVEGKSNRKWIGQNDQETAEKLQLMGVKDPWNKKLKGLGEIEKEVGKKAVDLLTYKPEGKPTVVTADDPRPLYDKNAEAQKEFGNYDD